MAESTHRVEVIPVLLEKHPNADSHSIVRIEGYQVCTRTDAWDGIPLAAYVPPDSIVPLTHPDFEFLKDPKKPEQTHVRVKAKRLRGEWSMGVLIPAPASAQVGDDVAEVLGVTHYDPPEPNANTAGETEKAPRKLRKKCPSCDGTGRVEDPQHGHGMNCEPCGGKGYPNDAEDVGFDYPKYDVEAFRKYGRYTFEPGERVFVTEKIHGANGRWMFDGERYYCGSRTEWKRESETNMWWKALRQYPSILSFLLMNPGTAVYGEVYGQVQDLKYGTKSGELRIAIFDILHQGKWVDARDGQQFQPNPAGPPAWTMPWVPLVGVREFNFEELLTLAEGPSLVPGAKHFREGVVIKPLTERWHSKCGRVNLKVVSNSYLERA